MTERVLRAYQACLNGADGQAVLYDLHAYVATLGHDDRAGASLVLSRLEKWRNPDVGKALNGTGPR
jgi:hypothetical protein